MVPIPIEYYYNDDKNNGKLKCTNTNCGTGGVFLIEYDEETNDKRSSRFETPSFLSIHNVNHKLPSQFKEFQKEFKHRHRYSYGEKMKDWWLIMYIDNKQTSPCSGSNANYISSNVKSKPTQNQQNSNSIKW